MYNLQLKSGRFPEVSDTNSLSESLPEDRRVAKSVVNEKLVKALGFESNEAALGKQFWIGVSVGKAEIVGVIADFNTGSLHEEIKPALITQDVRWANNANIKIAADADIPAIVNKVGQSFKKIFPQGVFEFNFLDQQLDALYKTEARLFNLFKIFAGLAILISCLGLWGLISFAAQQRTKEIGIRKVLGATISNIVTMLVKDFVVLVGIAITIAAPLTYWGMHKWLQDFAFRINIGWAVFVIAGLIAILIALVTVGMQAFKAAIANPVNALRSE
jgi:ABC-type antimicrobial peptide transport system permease subunit